MKSICFIFLLVVAWNPAAGLTREYTADTDSRSWQDAQSICKIFYRDLATITSLEEKIRCLQLGSSIGDAWIGLRKLSGNLMWADGEPYNQDNSVSNPVPDYSGDYCVFTFSSGFWLSSYCSIARKFYCYRFLILVKESKTWEEAQEFCRTNYTGLASVTSESSLRQLKLETVGTQTENVWTGLNFIDGTWLWVSGEPLGNQVSIPPQCPARPYRCGSLNTTSNTFNKQNCNDKLNFVCYWN